VPLHDEKQKPAPPPEWMRDAVAAEPAGFMKGVLDDARAGIATSASMIPARQRSQDKVRPPSGGEAPLQVPGINYIDAMCDAQDRVDRAAAMRVRVDTEAVERAMAERTSRRVKMEYDPLKRFDNEMPSAHREKGE
jgi:hypothetical protein